MAPTSVVPPPPISTAASSTSPPLSPQTASPTSTRSRIRAFNYLRGHHHSAPPTPVPPPPPPQQTVTTPTAPEQPAAMTTATIRQVSSNSTSPADDQHSPVSTSTTSWLPTVGGVSGLTRVPSAPTPADSVATTDASPLFFQNRTNTNGTISVGLDGAGEAAGPNGVANIGPSTGNGNTASNGLPDGKIPTIRFVPHVDPRSTRRPHTFAPMERSIKTTGEVVKVGRFSDRDNGNPVGFKSKVVSRRHCEFWWSEGSWYMKDVGSSSGTFLNHVRLSHPNTESKPYAVHDGDVVQLGIDFKGGEELIFRCVKMKLELNRDAKSINQFNVAAHRRIQNLGKPSVNKGTGNESHAGECAICLLNIAPCQPLFVAPCSHVWHYKCIRPIIETNYPILPCPNCREIADLEAEIDEGTDENWEDLDKAKEDSANESSAKPARGSTELTPEEQAEDRAKTPQPTEEMADPVAETEPMHIPLSSLSLAPNGTDGMPDPANQTPRNNAGPFVLNGTTGRI
ncbi:hypothetical protein H072_1440 [Dactylellina haptotyla CBS 200.50]|uniref:FHA domain-containing protein n=1 Tax=Dactylellina haptotyla (strain CBS 200.50) TaxID=1284197 RepID=S8AUA3_DACHA|nr:hypothetical protein H072_1440 [Dactylellina haptotyla CBS 200.50]